MLYLYFIIYLLYSFSYGKLIRNQFNFVSVSRHYYANSCWVIFKVKSCTPTSLRISRARQSSNFVEIALITRSVVELRGGADLARAARV
jgi:hypothetical protein